MAQMYENQYHAMSNGLYGNNQASIGSYSSSNVVVQADTMGGSPIASPSSSSSASTLLPMSGLSFGILLPTISLSLIFAYWYHHHRRRIHKRGNYSSIDGTSRSLMRKRNKAKSKYSDKARHPWRYSQNGDILDDEEDDDDPLSRYANYHRLPKGASKSLGNGLVRRSSLSQVSPKHPALERVPTFPIRLETMKLLRIVGVRMVAHGVQSQPRRVWISINDEAFVWQSEFKTKLPNNIGASSLLSVRGPVHNIPWGDIKFIDVGKNTESFKRADISEKMCWSILTLNGSLDLQAKSQLERDSMVSCMVSMLDEYNDGEDWRAHYYNTYGNQGSAAEETKVDIANKLPTRLHGGTVGGSMVSRKPPPSSAAKIMTSYSLMSNDSLPLTVDV